jgi:hypothetical protein
VSRPRRHPPRGHRGHARGTPGSGFPDPPGVRLLDERDGVCGRGGRGLGGGAHALNGRDVEVRRAARAALGRGAGGSPSGGGGDGGGDALSAADGGPGRGVHPGQR